MTQSNTVAIGNVIEDQNGRKVDAKTRVVACWEDAPYASCLVSYCTASTREIELVALKSGETFSYDERHGERCIRKTYLCERGIKSSSKADSNVGHGD